MALSPRLSNLSGNTSGSGGGIYNNNSRTAFGSKGSLTLTDCTISGNTALDEGGGIYNYVSSTLTIDGATVITDNRINSSNATGCVHNLGNLYLGGTTRITGNQLAGVFSRDTPTDGHTYFSEVYLLSGQVTVAGNGNGETEKNVLNARNITIIGILQEGTCIGVTKPRGEAFTYDYGRYMGTADPAAFFTDDSRAYAVGLNNKGEAYMADPFTVTFDLSGADSTGPDPQRIVPDGKVLKPADPSADSLIFNGWFADQECTTPWDFDTDTVSENTVLYAGWISAWDLLNGVLSGNILIVILL